MLESTTYSGIGNLFFAVALVMLAIAACTGLAFFLKTKFSFTSLSRHMNPQARLGIVESIDVDQKRKLILIRKDTTEHLVLIGGQEDLVISSSNAIGSPNTVTASNLIEIEPKAQAILSDNKVVTASNDGSLRQSEPVETTQAPKYQSEPVQKDNAPIASKLSNPAKTTLSNANEAELTRLISDALEATMSDQVNEQTVAKAVSMLSSEEEVTDFFDQARSRIFATPRPAARSVAQRVEQPREDTDDFQAVLRNQKQATAREQYRQRPQARQKPTRPTPPAPRRLDPIPDTAEERIQKLKALLGANKRRTK